MLNRRNAYILDRVWMDLRASSDGMKSVSPHAQCCTPQYSLRIDRGTIQVPFCKTASRSVNGTVANLLYMSLIA